MITGMIEKRLSGATVFAVALLALCAMGIAVATSEESEAITLDTHEVSYNVDKGGHLAKSGSYDVRNFKLSADHSVSTDYTTGTKKGLTFNASHRLVSDGEGTYFIRISWSVTGTATESGEAVFNSYTRLVYNAAQYEIPVRITVDIAGVPVTSISIAGPYIGEVGDLVLLTASISPSDADNRNVTWSIDSDNGFTRIDPNGVYCRVSSSIYGTVTIRCTADDGSGVYSTKTVSFEFYHSLYFYPNGGEGVPEKMRYGPTADLYHYFTIPDTIPTKEGHTFKGWAKTSYGSAEYQPGDRIYVSNTVNLFAIWEETPTTITISSAPPTVAVVGRQWSYEPTADVESFSVTVTGPSWMSVSGNRIQGTPSAADQHSVTVKVSKTGYTDAMQTFTLTVYPVLGFDSKPSFDGAFFYLED